MNSDNFITISVRFLAQQLYISGNPLNAAVSGANMVERVMASTGMRSSHRGQDPLCLCR